MVVNQPQLLNQRRGLDFGAGFYLTTREDQAKGFATTVVNRRKMGVPTISVYDFDESKANDALEILTFLEADASWLEFVRDNRLKTYSGKQYDLIIGPVANDRVFPTLQALAIGQFSVEAALVALRPYKLFDQYCLSSERALSLLRFLNCTVD